MDNSRGIKFNENLSLYGHRFQCVFHGIMNFGKLCDSNHVKDFLEMIRKACNADVLVISFRLGENLYEHRNTAAVDIGTLFKFQ